jgi:hypothetical protein
MEVLNWYAAGYGSNKYGKQVCNILAAKSMANKYAAYLLPYKYGSNNKYLRLARSWLC